MSVMTLSSDAIRKAGATLADTEDIVNEPMRIGSVVVSILLVEQEKSLIRASFRSKAPREADPSVPDIDVARIAQQYNGGGHRRAAGARMSTSLHDAYANIKTSLGAVFSA